MQKEMCHSSFSLLFTYLVSIWQEGMSMDHQVLAYPTDSKAKHIIRKEVWLCGHISCNIADEVDAELTNPLQKRMRIWKFVSA